MDSANGIVTKADLEGVDLRGANLADADPDRETITELLAGGLAALEWAFTQARRRVAEWEPAPCPPLGYERFADLERRVRVDRCVVPRRYWHA